jgi:hypothetical protein
VIKLLRLLGGTGHKSIAERPAYPRALNGERR